MLYRNMFIDTFIGYRIDTYNNSFRYLQNIETNDRYFLTSIKKASIIIKLHSKIFTTKNK